MRLLSRRDAVRLLIAATTPLVGASCRRSGQSLRIGIEAAYPPFIELGPDGQPHGFEIDLARAFLQRVGRAYVLVQSDFAALIPGLALGRFDAAIASINITDERRQRVDFSVPYYRTPACFVRPVAGTIAITREGLAGRRVGVQGATNLDDWLTRTWGAVAEIVRYPTQDALYLDMRAGRLDAMFSDLAAAQIAFLRKPGGDRFERVGRAYCEHEVVGDGVAVALPKNGSSELRAALDRAIEAVHASGEYARIQAAYFDFDLSCGTAGGA